MSSSNRNGCVLRETSDVELALPGCFQVATVWLILVFPRPYTIWGDVRLYSGGCRAQDCLHQLSISRVSLCLIPCLFSYCAAFVSSFCFSWNRCYWFQYYWKEWAITIIWWIRSRFYNKLRAIEYQTTLRLAFATWAHGQDSSWSGVPSARARFCSALELMFLRWNFFRERHSVT